MTQPYVAAAALPAGLVGAGVELRHGLLRRRRGVLIFDTLEGVYDNITQAVASVTDKPIIAVVYPHYHADHIGDIDQVRRSGAAAGNRSARSSRARRPSSRWTWPTARSRDRRRCSTWPRDSFDFDGLTVELHGFEWAAHSDDHSAWLLKQERSSIRRI